MKSITLLLLSVFCIQFSISAQKSVKIGNQTWMAENLSVTRFNNGDEIPQIESPVTWAQSKSPAWSYYDNDPKYSNSGLLYNYYTVSDPRGLCPVGWRVPNKSDLKALYQFIGGDHMRYTLRSATGWGEGRNGTDLYGFKGTPSGYRMRDGFFKRQTQMGFWWLTDKDFFVFSWKDITMDLENVWKDDSSFPASAGMSVRCIK